MLQPMTVVVGNVFEVELAVGFEEVEDGEKERDESPSHYFVLRCKGLPLGFGLLEENVLCNPFAHEIGEFGGDMQTMPYAAECVEVVIGRVINGV